MTAALLTLNAGSSSIKLALFECGRGGAVLTRIATGQVERIGADPRFSAHSADGVLLAERQWPHGEALSHEDLLAPVLDFAEHALGRDTLAAIGHRVVHGGTRFTAPTLVTPDVLDALGALVPLAPLHQPHGLAPMRTLAALRPGLPQVACFDTAFHHAMPALATRFPLPAAILGPDIRRYGFHGLNYDHVAAELRRVAPALAQGRVIAAHLGSGASLCAMRAGRSVDTTMGFTALDGLMMGTRSGAIDPGLVLHLQRRHGMGADAVEDLLYHRSGLLGVSGLSADMRVLLASADPRAREARELFIYRIVRETGALASVLGGLDALVFTAGIGEHAPGIRDAICQGLRWLGLRLDPDANTRPAGGAREIGLPGASPRIWIIPADEERVIARGTASVAWMPVHA